MPILLIVEKKVPQPPSPFTFNHVWLKNEDYHKLVQLNWISINEDDGRSFMNQFTSNITNIINVSSKWAKEFYKESKTLREVEPAIGVMMINRSADSLSSDEESRLVDLMKKRQELLANEEFKWQLKSRVIWKQEGDNNTKNFHNFANYQKAVNTIGKIFDEDAIKNHLSRKLLKQGNPIPPTF